MTPTGTMTNRVILDYYNGRPSIWVSVVDDEPQLHWLVLGYLEDFDVWIDVPLTWEEADQVIEHPPLALVDFLRQHAGQPARLRLSEGSHVSPPLIALTWLLPESDRPVEVALQLLLQEYDHNRKTVGLLMTEKQTQAAGALRELAAT